MNISGLELTKATRNLFVVGDDFQSIYAFRGARPALMGQFTRVFPDAKQVVLTRNYRSHDLIVDLGNRVIELNQGYQIEKEVIANRAQPEGVTVQIVGPVANEFQEAETVAEEILQIREQHPDTPWKEFAVLYRTNIQFRLYEEALAEHDIPCQVVGDVHFYESRDVKVVLDYLRTTLDTSDSSIWAPLLNRPMRFLASSTVNELRSRGWEAVVQHPKCQSFVQTIEQLKTHPSPVEAIGWLLHAHPTLVRSQDEDEPIKWMDSLLDSAFRHKTVAQFIRHVDWLIERSKTPVQDAVQLSTIHRSKGLEYDTVFIGGLAEGILPYKKAVAGEALREETRLCYVAITRARENLFLMTASQYGGKPREMSRFVQTLMPS